MGKIMRVSDNERVEGLQYATIPDCFRVAVATAPDGRKLLLRIEGSPACVTDAIRVDAEDLRRQHLEAYAWAYYCSHKMDLPISGMAGWTLEIVHESPTKARTDA